MIYDTDKSEFIANWDDSEKHPEYKSRIESLYMSPKGVYLMEITEGYFPEAEDLPAVIEDVRLEIVSKENAIYWLEIKGLQFELLTHFEDELEEG
jgi:hypothetical protein